MSHLFCENELLIFQLGDLGFKGCDGFWIRGFDQTLDESLLLLVQLANLAFASLFAAGRLIQSLIPGGFEHRLHHGQQPLGGRHAFEDVSKARIDLLCADALAILRTIAGLAPVIGIALAC
ncbi:hypothetical protein [uncultured Tateyamaria sp.]|uniref:hypothetical protein n=1 Tax=uncultured Tateyamaria sp. TaxID=455651 RepID=UPI00344ECF25